MSAGVHWRTHGHPPPRDFSVGRNAGSPEAVPALSPGITTTPPRQTRTLSRDEALLELPLEVGVAGDLSAAFEAVRQEAPGCAWLDGAGRRLLLRFEPANCPIPILLEALAAVGVTVRVDNARRLSPAQFRDAVARIENARWRGRFAQLAALMRSNTDLPAVAVAGILLLTATIVLWTSGPQWLRIALLAPAAVLASLRTAPEAWRSLTQLRLNVDVLMFAAAIGAAVLGRYEEGALLLFLFGAGAAGEHLAMSRAQAAIRSLATLAPATATLHSADGTLRDTPVEQVAAGQMITVRPFARVPLDGVVVEGASTVDESTLTGESIPVEKESGAAVFAGTMNAAGALEVRVSRTAGESTVARIMRMVLEAQAARSPVQRFTARVERWYVPFVFIAAAAVLLLPPLLSEQPWSVWFYRAMAFMTAASPCALALGTPAAVMCATARAARLGVLVKSGAHLETLARVRAIAYDKTGTLTRGAPRVAEVATVAPRTGDELLAMAAAIETRVTHPLADAIVAEASQRALTIPSAEDVQQISGRGAAGRIDGHYVALVKPASVPLDDWPAELRDAGARLSALGHTQVLVTINETPAGLIALADTVRPEAAAVIRSLREMGIARQTMLTGDHAPAAANVARQVGTDEHFAALAPEDKLRRIAELQRAYGPVAMVGDGVNDAPALAAADVGIAMGAARNDVALETADVALLANSLAKLPAAIALGRASNRIIRENLVLALGVIAIVAPLAALGYANLGVAVLLHEGSTLVVVLNALRLLSFATPGQSRRVLTPPALAEDSPARSKAELCTTLIDPAAGRSSSAPASACER